jgi:hypothetical protein
VYLRGKGLNSTLVEAGMFDSGGMEQNHMIIILIKDTPQLAAGYLIEC